MQRFFARAALAIAAVLVVAGCSVTTTGRADSGSGSAPPPRASTPRPSTRQLDPQQARRLQQVMIPLIQKMDHPLPLNEVKVHVIDDPQINAANAGAGEFYVTTGLLEKANDEQLRSIMAHEIAHADLGHVAKAQRLGAGLTLGAILLDQVLPGAGALTPIAGQLVANAYSRKEEYQADAHGVEILNRAGHNGKTLMASTLSWLMSTSGPSGGGFFATHPATGDRIQAVQRLPR